MKYTKMMGTGLIGVMVLFILVVVLFFANSYVSECTEGHTFNKENNICHYPAANGCDIGETPEVVKGAQSCLYEPKGFLNSNITKGIMVFLGVLFTIMLVLMFYFMASGTAGVKARSRISSDIAVTSWCHWFAQTYSIPIIGDIYDASAFVVGNDRHTTKKGDEEFLRFQVEVLKGKNPGIFTVETSLNKTAEHILNGNADYSNVFYSGYKRPRDFPLHTPDDPSERALQQLANINPEKAAEMHEQVLAKNLERGNIQQPQQPHLDEDRPIMIAPKPNYRKQYGYRR